MPSLEDKFHLSPFILYPAAYFCQYFLNLFVSSPFRLSPFTVRMLTMHRHFNIAKAEDKLGFRPLRAFSDSWPEAIEAARQRLIAEGVLPVVMSQATERKKL